MTDRQADRQQNKTIKEIGFGWRDLTKKLKAIPKAIDFLVFILIYFIIFPSISVLCYLYVLKGVLEMFLGKQ